MTKSYFILFLVFIIAFIQEGYSQDVIHLKSGEVLQIQIVATSNTDITYMTKTKSNTDTIITINKDEVVSLRRASENLEYAKKKEYTAEERLAIFEEGKMDADIYYTRYKRPGTLVLVTSLVSPIVGLIPAVISSATPVKDQNKWYPPSKEPKIDAYYSGYDIRAQQKKVKVVWRNWGVGLAVNFVLVLWLINN